MDIRKIAYTNGINDGSLEHQNLDIKRLSLDGYVNGADIADCPIRETCDVC